METLIVFYTRTGTTQKVAEDLAVHFNADMLELQDNKNRSGVLGFLRSGFDALTSNVTVINDFNHKLDEYDVILIGTPVWAGKMTPAIRTFLLGNAEVFPEVAFFVTLGGTSAQKTLQGMEDLAGKEPLASLVLEKEEALGSPAASKDDIDSFVKIICDKMESKTKNEQNQKSRN